MHTKEDVEKVLKTIVDPEISIDILTLELIYDIEIHEKAIKITMTLTSPMCPFGPQMINEVKTKVKEMKGIEAVDVLVTFSPPWKPSDQLRATLGV